VRHRVSTNAGAYHIYPIPSFSNNKLDGFTKANDSRLCAAYAWVAKVFGEGEKPNTELIFKMVPGVFES
jgi:hypothetical protein